LCPLDWLSALSFGGIEPLSLAREDFDDEGDDTSRRAGGGGKDVGREVGAGRAAFSSGEGTTEILGRAGLPRAWRVVGG
jgi:hypothetical protein